ncbi:hypothetical protein SEA_KIKO_43 [Gordonia phage Kiko]|uniref:DUF6551 family protein n=1 Tax=Gordonia rubripertincta TaxID=36822 RepID=UPI000FDF6873|nr:DUF6551 family protein [Gordonia rubripertincta]AZV00767.1 hypothetical protein SEA_KIKO_43 [Gordonia phage Kiko]QMU22534.1 hypothetical protein H3V45_08725 [Gordonia rubripertincta]
MAVAAPTTYVTAIKVEDLFADPTYQRELDVNRAKAMAHTWDPRLVGVIDVSDRGDTSPNSPRYAIINGQHRWKAAQSVDPAMVLVCNVHTGLTVAEEAQLFWDIDRKTKSLQVWDRWYARRAAGEPRVVAIDATASAFGLTVTHLPGPASIQCFAALEYVYTNMDPEALRAALEFIGDVWPGDTAARHALVVKGIAHLLWEYADDLDSGRLADALSEITPKQLVARAKESSATSGGALWKCVARVAGAAYNRSRGPRLAISA